MKYRVHFVRVEHQVYLIEVDANDEDEAGIKAGEIYNAGNINYDNYTVVHAEEFINQIDKVPV